MWRRGEVACSIYMRALPCCPRTFRCENTTLGSAPAQDVNLSRASTNAQVSPEHMRSMPACSSAMYTLDCGRRWQRETNYLRISFRGGAQAHAEHTAPARVPRARIAVAGSPQKAHQPKNFARAPCHRTAPARALRSCQTPVPARCRTFLSSKSALSCCCWLKAACSCSCNSELPDDRS